MSEIKLRVCDDALFDMFFSEAYRVQIKYVNSFLEKIHAKNEKDGEDLQYCMRVLKRKIKCAYDECLDDIIVYSEKKISKCQIEFSFEEVFTAVSKAYDSQMIQDILEDLVENLRKKNRIIIVSNSLKQMNIFRTSGTKQHSA